MHDATLLLIDGMAAAYRAFYAIKHLKTSAGKPSNAIFGFSRMVEQLVKAWSPSHLAVVFDGGIPQSRLDLVPEYKAQRKPMPDALRDQLDGINAYLEAAAIPRVRLDACEADDVMATLAVEAARDDVQVLLATHDKDLFQLVNASTGIVPVAGTPERMGIEGVEVKTGVRPDQIVDWLALIGDSSDNIKGVPGVGPKTATRLLCTYGHVETLWEHLDEIPREKLRQKLDQSRGLIDRNQRMVTLDTSVAGVPAWKTLKAGPLRAGPLLAFYEAYELHGQAQALREPELF